MRRFAGVAGLVLLLSCTGSGESPLALEEEVVDGLIYSTTLRPSETDRGSLEVEMSIRNPSVDRRVIEIACDRPITVRFRRRADDTSVNVDRTACLRINTSVVVPSLGVRRLSYRIRAADLAAAPSDVYVVSVGLLTDLPNPTIVYTTILSLPLGELR